MVGWPYFSEPPLIGRRARLRVDQILHQDRLVSEAGRLLPRIRSTSAQRDGRRAVITTFDRQGRLFKPLGRPLFSVA